MVTVVKKEKVEKMAATEMMEVMVEVEIMVEDTMEEVT